MLERSEVVVSVLGELQEATELTGLAALTKVAQNVSPVLGSFPLPPSPCLDVPEWAGVDSLAHRLYPSDAPRGLLPLSCRGEGNMLFDAVSMLLVGSTGLSLELQVRTVVEMAMWKRYYLCGMIDSKMMLQAVRFSLCVEESEDMINLPANVLEAIFDADVKASCFPGSYANMWHVYALASVLQYNIFSIYPMFNLKIRPYFHRMIRPRTWPQDSEIQTLHVMWSGELQSESIFRPDHFVALVQTSSMACGSPISDPSASPAKSDELLNEPRMTYPNMKDKYNITKRTFYRWKRQTQEHCKKSTARYEAKYFLQACYNEGKLIPLHQFKLFFPEISRSSYYNWKQELLKSGGHFSVSSSSGEISPGESTEQEAWSSPDPKDDDIEHHDSVASMFGLSMGKPDTERAQNVANMQEAKRCLQNCIAMNASFPFRIFKRNFPGISRSTYYNWRREAMMCSRGYKGSAGSSDDGSDGDKSQSPKRFSPMISVFNSNPIRPRRRVCRRKNKSLRMAYIGKKQIRNAAKCYILKSKCSPAKFKLKFPNMSLCFYWLWKNAGKASKLPADMPVPSTEEIVNVAPSLVTAPSEMVPINQNMAPYFESPPYIQKAPMASSMALPKPAILSQMPAEEQTYGLDVVAMANFKAKAKLFLQQRFEEKSFPSFKEFRSYFPYTPRSTYYMWKRALYHGVSLIHG
ncbi:vertnin [Boleophthalmus pectinirostris]|uniref:vertnin n=1 Tax=Boleophthalmus pectinirostris TaxID=150288 RepID=UPI00242EB758|nr:vertnin [Boleophthalmus pectinirostris]XP_055005095.1 vertnin [Boleophthalmus pectinirostris]